MSQSPLFLRARDEVVSLHEFFVAWYDKKTAATTDIDRFERVMGPGMKMIPPSGHMLERDAVVSYVRGSRAAFDGDYAIEIADVEPVWEAGNAIVVTYIEKQERRGVKTARRASALFVESSSAPNGVEWRHLHETWMQTAE
ncbi:DUF4440 domain-containing protein [Rhizobium grahamii]|uniref:Uncharacterized protein n=1 Tax=Rhizobium grahamii CCGE 502 TaxID=990285 RepID=S3IAJ9_9HYPH|nr:DUF4440 domain-containing protein [Rhizobium grahamii]EPE96303.1 hypothetical protein RGCCGE502_20540 [Rhizobium grahamii CCGE 502]